MGVAAMRVPTVFTAVDKFSSVVSKMTRSVSAFGNTAEAAAMRTSRKFNDAGTSMLTAGAGIAVGLGLAVNEAMKFEKAMSNISTLTTDTPEQIKAIGESILNMSTKIPVSISDLTTGMYDVVSAGIQGTAHQLDVLDKSSRLAVAGLGTTKEAVNITTSALNAFGKEAGTAYEVTNLLMKSVKYGKTTVSGISESFGMFAAIMKNSGVTLKEYLASTTALTTAGMTMATAQAQVSSATMALIKPNNQMLKVYKQLGVKDVPAFIKANGGLVNTLDLVGKKGKSMGLMLSKVFGRKEGLSAYLSLMGALAPKFKEIMTDMSGGSDLLNTAFAKQQKTFSAQFQIMKNKVVALGIAIGNELMPRISGFIDTISPMISGLIEWIKRNEWLATTILSITTGLLVLGGLAKVGAVLFYGLARVIGIVSTITEAYTFVSTMAALANVGFGTALWSTITAMWAFVVAEAAVLAPILLIIAALGALVWIIIDMIQHWEDWRDVVLMMLGPIGQVWLLMEKIAKHWENITSLFQGEGISGAIEGIGTMLNDLVLGTLIKIFDIMGRIPLIGSPFKEMADDLKGVMTQIPSEMSIGNLGMQGASNFSSYGGAIPTWDYGQSHENLAGKNDSNSTKSSNGGIFTINVNDPNKSLNPFETQKMFGVGGIPIILTYNQGQRQ